MKNSQFSRFQIKNVNNLPTKFKKNKSRITPLFQIVLLESKIKHSILNYLNGLGLEYLIFLLNNAKFFSVLVFNLPSFKCLIMLINKKKIINYSNWICISKKDMFQPDYILFSPCPFSLPKAQMNSIVNRGTNCKAYFNHWLIITMFYGKSDYFPKQIKLTGQRLTNNI